MLKRGKVKKKKKAPFRIKRGYCTDKLLASFKKADQYFSTSIYPSVKKAVANDFCAHYFPDLCHVYEIEVRVKKVYKLKKFGDVWGIDYKGAKKV